MTPKDFYQQLYSPFDTLTPLRFDCGRLCGGACCQAGPELPGMYLFPGEQELFEGKEGFQIKEATLPGYGPVPLLVCSGQCDRAMRPLACRVFPLAPKLMDGKLTVRADPRGRAVCPLARDGAAGMTQAFKSAALDAFAALLERPQTNNFMKALLVYLDEFEYQILQNK